MMKKRGIILIFILLVNIFLVGAEGNDLIYEGEVFGTVSPANIEFGKFITFGEYISGPQITFDFSQNDVPIEMYAEISGNSLFDFFEYLSEEGWEPMSTFHIQVASNEIKNFETRIIVPSGTPAGIKEGVITYTIFLAPPSPPGS